MDLNAACAGFTYGLITASGLLAAGSRKVLLIGAETMTRTLNWEDRTNAFLFGDGAIHFVRNVGSGSADSITLQAVGTIAGGEVVSTDLW